jgi:hypothetical protein
MLSHEFYCTFSQSLCYSSSPSLSFFFSLSLFFDFLIHFSFYFLLSVILFVFLNKFVLSFLSSFFSFPLFAASPHVSLSFYSLLIILFLFYFIYLWFTWSKTIQWKVYSRSYKLGAQQCVILYHLMCTWWTNMSFLCHLEIRIRSPLRYPGSVRQENSRNTFRKYLYSQDCYVLTMSSL